MHEMMSKSGIESDAKIDKASAATDKAETVDQKKEDVKARPSKEVVSQQEKNRNALHAKLDEIKVNALAYLKDYMKVFAG